MPYFCGMKPQPEIWQSDAEEEEMLPEAEPEKRVFLDFQVDRGQEPLRIDKFLMVRLSGFTRNKIQQALDDELITINGQAVKANYKVRPGDHLIAYTFRAPESTEILPEDIPLDVVYEDDDLMVINKPANMVVHPGHGNYSGTVVNALSFYLQKQNGESSALPRIGLVHRIDKDTTGLLVIGKTEQAMNHLAEQFKKHTVRREYVALVWGDVEEQEGTVDTYIGRHQRLRKIFAVYEEGEGGKHAVTHYRVLERMHYVTLVECRLETGRTHQIRVHMKHIGHTLFNDHTYGGDRILKGTVYARYRQFVENCFDMLPRQALHAKTLGFRHPRTGQDMFFDSPVPDDFQRVIERWRAYSSRPGANLS
jgi:23S rRNA pseudouridine1911/1915/1917 synthase